MMAGLVQVPSENDPIGHLSTGRLRQRHILNRLVVTKVLSQAQADAAFAAPRPALIR
jgi:membrane carboxypeptidase/penicillin-binding protein